MSDIKLYKTPYYSRNCASIQTYITNVTLYSEMSDLSILGMHSSSLRLQLLPVGSVAPPPLHDLLPPPRLRFVLLLHPL